MEICRACLLTENNMIPFDECFVENYNLLTNLNVSVCDGLPQFSCKNCAEVINYFTEFRIKAISSEKTLREVVENIKPEEISQLENKPNISVESDCKLEVKSEVIDEILEEDEFNFNEDIELDIKEDAIETQDYAECKNDKTKKRTYKKKSKSKIGDSFSDDVIEDATLKTRKNKKNEVTKLTSDVLSCGLCKKEMHDHDTLNGHLEVHKTHKTCEICQEQYKSWQQLFGHRLQHVPPKERRCHICNKYYIVSSNLEFHYLIAHSEEQEISLSCTICLKSYSNPTKLRKHMSYAHTSKTAYICDFCSKRCKTKSGLRSHILIHSDVKSFVCQLCGFSCKLSSGLKDHMIRKHSPEKVTCEKCNRIFKNQEDHDKHKCTVKPVICPICGKELRPNKGVRYNRHMETHEPVGRYKCDRCPKTYRTKQALRVHLNRHDGKRTYKCKVCPAMFYGYSSLIKHRRIHTGEKPYVCKICSRAFSCNSNLKTHMKVHGLFLINHKNKDPENVTEVM